MKPEKKAARKLIGMRMELALVKRIEVLARKTKRSPRQMLEILAEAGLPEQEKLAGIKTPSDD